MPEATNNHKMTAVLTAILLSAFLPALCIGLITCLACISRSPVDKNLTWVPVLLVATLPISCVVFLICSTRQSYAANKTTVAWIAIASHAVSFLLCTGTLVFLASNSWNRSYRSIGDAIASHDIPSQVLSFPFNSPVSINYYPFLCDISISGNCDFAKTKKWIASQKNKGSIIAYPASQRDVQERGMNPDEEIIHTTIKTGEKILSIYVQQSGKSAVAVYFDKRR